LKFLGILAVIGSCLGIGLMRVKAAGQEIRTLHSLMRGIRVMRAELSCRLCPLEELLVMAANLAGAETGVFFQSCAASLSGLNENSFVDLWIDACRKCLPALSAESRGQLETLGASLGRYELDEQLAACDRYLRCAEETANGLLARLPEQRKLSLALSAAAGAFLCLLIL